MVIRAKASAKNVFSLISSDKLRQLYRTMLRCRALEEHVSQLFQEGALKGKYRSTAGEEAIRVGAAIDLRPGDTLVASHVSSSLIRGVPLPAILSLLHEAAENGRPTTVARQMKLATEVAAANKKQNHGNIVVAFSRERSSAGWDTAVSLAGRYHLPMLFVEHPLLSAARARSKKQSGVPDLGRNLKSSAHHLPRIPVDGHDVVAVYRVAFEAMLRARQGGGATLMECIRYRTGGDPLDRMQAYLTAKRLFKMTWKQQTLDDIARELRQR